MPINPIIINLKHIILNIKLFILLHLIFLMEQDDQIKQAFQKVRIDIDSLNNDLNSYLKFIISKIKILKEVLLNIFLYYFVFFLYYL